MKNILISIITFFAFINLNAQQELSGQDSFVEQLGSNSFKVTYRIFLDCKDTNRIDTIPFEVYDDSTNALILSSKVSVDYSNFGVKTAFNAGLNCAKIYYYHDTIQLANNVNGYYISTNYCCRVHTTNIDTNAGYTFNVTIPDPAISSGNSSPKFSDTIIKKAFTTSGTHDFDVSCTDDDGDSLVYTLIVPYENGNIKSFVKATLYSPFIVSHLAGPGGYTTIYNDTIGLLWVQTRYYGCFAFGIVCEEFRNGIKIGEVYKDFVMCNPGIWFGTQELNFLDMSVIYPNPSNGVVNIKSEGIEIIQIQVLGLNGNLLQTIKKGKKNKLDLSHLSPGIYFLRLNSNNGLVTKKIVIN